VDSFEGVANMMDDHYVICRARNHLVDALKALLKADIMTKDDFTTSLIATMAAAVDLNELLRKSEGS